ncbi:hypothetical protein GGS20DRAFT_467429 [Poronia punctata]|nr:hypothetical protein GGS20DRAFT_467429 [Poronia punctata]
MPMKVFCIWEGVFLFSKLRVQRVARCVKMVEKCRDLCGDRSRACTLVLSRIHPAPAIHLTAQYVLRPKYVLDFWLPGENGLALYDQFVVNIGHSTPLGTQRPRGHMLSCGWAYLRRLWSPCDTCALLLIRPTKSKDHHTIDDYTNGTQLVFTSILHARRRRAGPHHPMPPILRAALRTGDGQYACQVVPLGRFSGTATP